MPEKKPFPQALPFVKLLGPSFIILALGLGSGEVILWPFLAANYGLGIAWGALLGITFQYFMNMEIERYALAKGESVFVGISRMFKKAPWWFILSTFIGFGIPGIIAASAKVTAHLAGLSEHRWIAIGFLVAIGLILSSGKTVYGMMEWITKHVLLIGTPFVFILAILVAEPSGWLALAKGLVGQGDGFAFLPRDLLIGGALATFLGAFAYSGAGGNLNLTQSIYVKEKGYGMGKYAQRISGLFSSGKKEKILLSGTDFALNKSNLANFRQWWRRVSAEHLVVFWFMGLLTMSLLMLLSYSTAYQSGRTEVSGIDFVIVEGQLIGEALWPVFGALFLAAVIIMLFQTQLGVMDSTSRIMSENFALHRLSGREGKINMTSIYYKFLWAQIGFGIFLFLINFKEPLTLLILGAVINAVAMFVHLGLVNWMNIKVLPKEIQAPAWRKLVMLGIFIFFGVFSAVTLWDKLL